MAKIMLNGVNYSAPTGGGATNIPYSADTPKANGTASAGSSDKVSRGDHVHPAQTSVSGNSGSATKLQTARKIGNASFNGTTDITLAQMGAAATNHTHNNYASKAIYGDDHVSFGRDSDSVKGTNSFCWADNGTLESYPSEATADLSVVLGGYDQHAKGDYSAIVGGQGNIVVSGTCGGVFGSEESVVKGSDSSVIGGYQNLVEGYEAGIFGGFGNTVKGSQGICIGGDENMVTGSRGSCISGTHNTAGHVDSICLGGSYLSTSADEQIVMGHFNSSNKNAALIIGNGVYQPGIDMNPMNIFEVEKNGNVYAQGKFSASGADYAELFEWEDVNPYNEDRRGYFVTMVGNKIKKASTGDYILGIVSANPCVLGNSAIGWNKRFLKDEFGAYLMEDFSETVKRKKHEYVINAEGKRERIEIEYEEEIPRTRYVQNPNYDPDMEYVDRLSRPEWDAVGMVGVLAVYDDGTCLPGGYCTVSESGTAVATGNTEYEIVNGNIVKNYRVMERVTENIIKVVLR